MNDYLFMENPFIKFLEQFEADLLANPDATENDYNGQAVFEAFIAKYPLDSTGWFFLAWCAGDYVKAQA